MKNKLLFSVMLTCSIVIGFALMSCSNSSLTGIWELENKSLHGQVERIEFNKNGTGKIGGSITWKIKGKRLIFTDEYGQTFTRNFDLSGSTLTIESIGKYIKVN